MITAIGLLLFFIGAGLYSAYRTEDAILRTSKVNSFKIYAWFKVAGLCIFGAVTAFVYIVMRLFGWDVPEEGPTILILGMSCIVSSLAYLWGVKEGREEIASIFLPVGVLCVATLIAGAFL